MFVNRMPRYEILSEDAMATLETGLAPADDRDRRRVHGRPGARPVPPGGPEGRGQRRSSSTPTSCSSRSPRRRSEFDLQARNPANSVHIGGDSMAFGAVYGPPFVREGDVRRDGTMEDFRNFSRLAQSFAVLDSAGGVVNEPNDTPLDSRHLDMVYALQTLTDKIYMGNVVSGRQRRGHDRDDRDPVRLARGDRGDAGDHLADQLQLAAALGRPDARVAVRVHRGQPARGADAVHPDGRDVAGDDPGRAGPADRRGAVRASRCRS